MFEQRHANLWSNSVIVLHSAGQKTHISGLSSFLTWVVKRARKVFITSHYADLFAFTQNQQKKESDSRSRVVHKQRLQAWRARSAEQKMSDGELPGIACWQDRVETQLYVRWKGEDIWFVLCSVQMAPASSQMSVKTVFLESMLQRERGAYIFAVQLFMYLPWFLTGFHVPKPPTCPPKPDGTRRSNRKRKKVLRVSWVMNSPYALQNSACE